MASTEFGYYNAEDLLRISEDGNLSGKVSVIAGLESGIFLALSEVAGVASKLIKFAVLSDSLLGVSTTTLKIHYHENNEISIEGYKNGAKFALAEAGTVAILMGAVVVLSGGAVTLLGAVVIAGGTSLLYSGMSAATEAWYSNGDEEVLKFYDQSGNLQSGVFYPDGIDSLGSTSAQNKEIAVRYFISQAQSEIANGGEIRIEGTFYDDVFTLYNSSDYLAKIVSLSSVSTIDDLLTVGDGGNLDVHAFKGSSEHYLFFEDDVVSFDIPAIVNGSQQLITVNSIYDGSVGATDLLAGDGSGVSLVMGGVGAASVITGTGGDDLILAGNQNDTINGGDGDDVILGQGGNDKIIASDGDDVIDGGAGVDLLDFSSTTSDVTVDLLTSHTANVDEIIDNDHLVYNIEDITTGSGKDIVAGNGDGNIIRTNGGNDSVVGNGGNDFIDGGAGADTIDGGVGDDDILGDTGNDSLFGSFGRDSLIGGDGDDTIDGGTDNDILVGGKGVDKYKFSGSFGNDTIIGDSSHTYNLNDIIEFGGVALTGVASIVSDGDDYTLGSNILKILGGDVTSGATIEILNGLSNSVTVENFSNGEYGISFAPNTAPVAVDDTASTSADESVTISLSSLVSNDRDLEDGSILISQIDNINSPTNGTLQSSGSTSLVYTPSAGFTGTDSFTYTIVDSAGLVSNEATVSIDVASAGGGGPTGEDVADTAGNDDNINSLEDLNDALNDPDLSKKLQDDLLNDLAGNGDDTAQSIKDKLAQDGLNFSDEANADTGQTSSLFDDMLDGLESLGIPAQSWWDKLKDTWQGIKDSVGNFFDEVGDFVDDSLQQVSDFFGVAEAARVFFDPLMVDIDGDGVELINANDSQVFFDLNGDGTSEKIGWVAPDDALFAVDRNGNGNIDDVSELFGSPTRTGFQEMSDFDSNADQLIDVNDAQFNEILVWQDKNSDGVADDGEIKTLTQAGISEISLDVTAVNRVLEGNIIPEVSTANVFGQDQEVAEVLLALDTTSSLEQPDGSAISTKFETLFLPQSRGYGTVQALHKAMSVDDALLTMVQDFSATDITTTTADDLTASIRGILFQWAGVSDVDPTSRGNRVDGQELGFIERILGTTYVDTRGGSHVTTADAANAINRSWASAYEEFAARLLVQGPFAEIFPGAVYDFATDNLGFNTSLNDVINSVQNINASQGSTLAAIDVLLHNVDPSASDALSQYDAIHDFLLTINNSEVINFGGISIGTGVAEDTGFSARSADINMIVGKGGDDHLVAQFNAPTLFYGDGGADYISGSSENDTFHGGTGNDYIFAGLGDDVIFGGDGDDDILGSLGADTIYGGAGNDSISMTTGNHSSKGEYADGGAGNDSILGGDNNPGTTLLGGSGDDTIIGDGFDWNGSHNGYFDGGAGNDLISGTSGTIAGGMGDDTISSLSHRLTFLIEKEAGATDLITSFWTGTDKIDVSRLGVLAMDELNFSQVGANIVLDLGDGNTYTIENLNLTELTPEHFIFADSAQSITGSSSADTIIGNLGNDTFDGGSGADSIQSGAGNDSVNGGVGADIIDGGAGNDTLDGDSDDDTISGNEGDDTLYGDLGNDVINGNEGNDFIHAGNGDDTLYGGAGADILDGGAGRDRFYLGTNDNAADVVKFISASHTAYGAWNYVNDFELGIDKIDLSALGVSFADLSFGTSSDGTDSYIHDGSTFRIKMENVTGITESDLILAAGTTTTPTPTPVYNEIIGTSGADTLTGGSGADSIFGGSGDDRLYAEAGADILDGGAGRDRFYLGSNDGASDVVKFTDATHTAYGAWNYVNDFELGIDKIDLSALGITFADLSFSTSSDGTDSYIHDGSTFRIKMENVTGISESDLILTGGTTTPVPTPAYNEIIGTSGADTLTGGTGADSIFGGSGDDRLYGETGADILDGGAGRDRFYLGSNDGAADIVKFTDATHTAYGAWNYVNNFELGIDKIDLSALGITFADLSFSTSSDGTDSYIHDGSTFRIKMENVTGITESDLIM